MQEKKKKEENEKNLGVFHFLLLSEYGLPSVWKQMHTCTHTHISTRTDIHTRIKQFCHEVQLMTHRNYRRARCEKGTDTQEV